MRYKKRLVEVQEAANKLGADLRDAMYCTDATLELLDVLAEKIESLTPIEKDLLQSAICEVVKGNK